MASIAPSAPPRASPAGLQLRVRFARAGVHPPQADAAAIPALEQRLLQLRPHGLRRARRQAGLAQRCLQCVRQRGVKVALLGAGRGGERLQAGQHVACVPAARASPQRRARWAADEHGQRVRGAVWRRRAQAHLAAATESCSKLQQLSRAACAFSTAAWRTCSRTPPTPSCWCVCSARSSSARASEYRRADMSCCARCAAVVMPRSRASVAAAGAGAPQWVQVAGSALSPRGGRMGSGAPHRTQHMPSTSASTSEG